VLSPGERARLHEWLLGARARAARLADRFADETGELLQRVGARDPCAYRSPSARRDDETLIEQGRRTKEGQQILQSIDRALRRLEEEPEALGVCARCGEPIPMDRLEVIPYTAVCGACAAG
jgi:RNA polymerase-binding transcription factor DksA